MAQQYFITNDHLFTFFPHSYCVLTFLFSGYISPKTTTLYVWCFMRNVLISLLSHFSYNPKLRTIFRVWVNNFSISFHACQWYFTQYFKVPSQINCRVLNVPSPWKKLSACGAFFTTINIAASSKPYPIHPDAGIFRYWIYFHVSCKLI